MSEPIYTEHDLASHITEAKDALRKEIAAEVEAEGCVCFDLMPTDTDEDPTFEGDYIKVVKHGRRCPIALAAKIRSGE